MLILNVGHLIKLMDLVHHAMMDMFFIMEIVSLRLIINPILIALGAVVLAACTPTTETVTIEVTRVITETVVEEGETVEVTRVVTETVVETVEVEPEAEPAGPKDLIVCMGHGY